MKKNVKKISAGLVAAFAAIALASCSSTGGAPEKTEENTATGGGVDTERMVVSFISHGAPGDTYWDLVRKGAEDAAKKDNIEPVSYTHLTLPTKA